jgi:hypothetical protein
MNNTKLFEGLEQGDLARLINVDVTLDEFISKMGEDQDVAVLAFRVGGKEPANDLMNFIERGYDWVLDSDVSPGELDNGEYVVFVELERSPALIKNIEKLMRDISKLADEDDDVWKFVYKDDPRSYELTAKNLQRIVPATPDAYLARYGEDLDYPDLEFEKELKAMQEVARVPIKKNKQFLDDDIKALKSRAGLL